MIENEKFLSRWPIPGRSDVPPPGGGDPSRVIMRALFDARRRGLDDVSQVRYAVAAVLQVRPDMTATEAAQSIEHVRRQPLSTTQARRHNDLLDL